VIEPFPINSIKRRGRELNFRDDMYILRRTPSFWIDERREKSLQNGANIFMGQIESEGERAQSS